MAKDSKPVIYMIGTSTFSSDRWISKFLVIHLSPIMVNKIKTGLLAFLRR